MVIISILIWEINSNFRSVSRCKSEWSVPSDNRAYWQLWKQCTICM